MRGLLSLILLGLAVVSVQAQDIIIKNDKTEISAKVIEIQESVVKYKKFDFQEGPIYNINKAEIFMIIYENGSRESFVQNVPASTSTQTQAKSVSTTAPKPAQAEQRPTNSQAVEEKKEPAVTASSTSTQNPVIENVKYEPSKLLLYTQYFSGSMDGFAVAGAGFSVEGASEYPAVPNFMNIGLSTILTFVSPISTSIQSASEYKVLVYASGYISLNRMMGNYEDQNKGFFPFVQMGPTLQTLSIRTTGGTSDSSLGVGFDVRTGIDYKFTPNFGLTLITHNFSGVGGGITFHW